MTAWRHNANRRHLAPWRGRRRGASSIVKAVAAKINARGGISSSIGSKRKTAKSAKAYQ